MLGLVRFLELVSNRGGAESRSTSTSCFRQSSSTWHDIVLLGNQGSVHTVQFHQAYSIDDVAIYKSQSDYLAGTLTGIDSQVFTAASSGTISVSAVPETSSLALLGLVGLTGAGVTIRSKPQGKGATAI